MASYAEAVTVPRKKGGPKKLRSIEIEKAQNGGHTVTHRFEHEPNGPYHESEQHVFGASEGKKLSAHLAKHLEIKIEAGGDE